MYKIIIIITALLIAGNEEKSSLFISPLDIPLTLSANFGELRSGHFHSGVDFKTNGVKGESVYSVADGYIYRISVSPTGFGKALYIRHSGGLSTVYGHLDSFIPSITEFVTEYQYKEESFKAEIFPKKDQFIMQRGELIGFSGNSGSSLGPHLHFEIRNSENENPLDPIQYLPVEDNIKPVINLLMVYSGKPATIANGYGEKTKLDVSGSGGRYHMTGNDPIYVSGEAGFGISTWDFVDNSWSKCGVRTIEVNMDGEIIYNHSIDEFSFSETRYINSHIDYEEYVRTRTFVQKAFVSPNDKLSIYKEIAGNGLITLNDHDLHRISIYVTDFNGNISSLEFNIQKERSQTNSFNAGTFVKKMPFSTPNEFSHHDIRVTFPENSFYDTLFFNYKKSHAGDGDFADIHHIHNRYFPVHKHFNLSIRPIDVNEYLVDKLCLVYINDNTVSYAGGEFSEGFITGNVRSLGKYSIGIDTIPPELSFINLPAASNFKGRREIKIGIKDDFSGIRSYRAEIDGKWTLFEWDPKNDIIIYRFDNQRLTPNSDHQLIITATDNRNNNTKLSKKFFW